MQHKEQPTREFLKTNRPLIRRIVAITSKRRHLSATDEEALSELVEAKLNQPDTDRLGRFQGASSLRSFLAVVVQRLYQALMAPPGADSAEQQSSPLVDAIRQTTATLPSRESLVVKMWFESGMTTQKIATVLQMQPADVHAVVAKRIDRVQDCLAQLRTSPLGTPQPDTEEPT